MSNTKKILHDVIQSLIDSDNLEHIRNSINHIINNFDEYFSNDSSFDINLEKNYFTEELLQIVNTYSLERTRYYLKRFHKSLVSVRTSKINDINLNKWKQYKNIITDSLWIMDRRDNTGGHNASYWGNFIPQIPNQLLQRYTKKKDWVLDPFAGSGTTLIESIRLNRNALGIELSPLVTEIAKKNIFSSLPDKNYPTIIIEQGDSTTIDFNSILSKHNIDSFQFALLHPPYWDIIKFSDEENDLSNSKNLEDFLNFFGSVIDNITPVLDSNRYLAVVIGDKYTNGEWIPLGFYVMQKVLERNYKLKSTIVKNFEETRAKRSQKELWRYRALAGGFYVFKHEYIFIFQKGK